MLLTITNWWQSMEVLEKTFWIITLLFSLLFIVQTILSFMNGDDGIDQTYFSVKNIITFFTIFGWVGIAGIKVNLPTFHIILYAFMSGTLIMAFMIILFIRIIHSRVSGILDIRNAMYLPAETHLNIPAERSGYGMVHIHIKGTLHELRAMTDDKVSIPTGTKVRVMGIINENVLLVTSLN